MVDFNRVGQLMRQAGADLSGQGLQFRQQQLQEQELARQRAQSLDDQRKKALAIDARLALNHLNNNDLNSFGRLVQNRIENVQRLGGDPTDTLQIADMVSRGEIDQAKSLLGDITARATEMGYLSPQQPDRKVLKTEKGRVTFLNKDGSVSEEAIQGAITQPTGLELSDIRGVANDVEKMTKDAAEVKNAAQSLEKISKTKSATDKLAAIFTFMKALDPASVVRDDEQRQVIGTGGVANAFSGYINELRGKGALSEEVFDQMVLTAQRLANEKIDGTAVRTDKFLGAFGDQLPINARARLLNIVPSKFDISEGITESKPSTVSGKVERLETLGELGQGTAIPQQMVKDFDQAKQQKTFTWEELTRQ